MYEGQRLQVVYNRCVRLKLKLSLRTCSHISAILELALEHVEEKIGVTLSRQIGTPNIASKGKVEARTVLIPKALLNNAKPDEPLLREAPKTSSSEKIPPQMPKPILKNRTNPIINDDSSNVSPRTETEGQPRPRPLIEDITNAHTQPAVSSSTTASASAGAAPTLPPENEPGDLDIGALSVLPAPRWAWSEDEDGDGALRIEVDLPSLVSLPAARLLIRNSLY